VFHCLGKPDGFGLVGLYLAAEIGVKPYQVIDGGMIGG
jgi:hypothetical protein